MSSHYLCTFFSHILLDLNCRLFPFYLIIYFFKLFCTFPSFSMEQMNALVFTNNNNNYRLNCRHGIIHEEGPFLLQDEGLR